MDKSCGKLLVYTRTPDPGLYHRALAYSVHFAYSDDGVHFEPFHQNYGILFAPGEISPDNTIEEKGLARPYLFRLPQGGYGIEAVRTDADGNAEHVHLLWTSKDLHTFVYHGVMPDDAAKDPARAACDNQAGHMPDGIVPGNMLEVDRAFGRELFGFWSPLRNTGIIVPESISARSVDDIQKAKVKAVIRTVPPALKR